MQDNLSYFNERVSSIEQHPLQIPTSCPKSTKSKRAMETASVSHDEEHQHAVISFADGAKVQQNFETTKDLAKKNCLLSYHSALIAGASARQPKQSWHRVPSLVRGRSTNCRARQGNRIAQPKGKLTSRHSPYVPVPLPAALRRGVAGSRHHAPCRRCSCCPSS